MFENYYSAIATQIIKDPDLICIFSVTFDVYIVALESSSSPRFHAGWGPTSLNMFLPLDESSPSIAIFHHALLHKISPKIILPS